MWTQRSPEDALQEPAVYAVLLTGKVVHHNHFETEQRMRRCGEPNQHERHACAYEGDNVAPKEDTSPFLVARLPVDSPAHFPGKPGQYAQDARYRWTLPFTGSR